jgi:acetoacetate decarboxylase
MKYGYSMPSTNPLFPEPPYFYKSNQIINIVFATNPEILRELVPAPLQPNPDNIAFIYVGEFNMDVPLKGSYLEAGIGIPVTFKERPGNFMTSLYLNSGQAIAGGREIWGWPKKDATIDFTSTNGTFHTSVIREGTEIIKASVKVTQQVNPIPDQSDSPAYNLKIIPSAVKGLPPEIVQLTSAVIVSQKKELWSGEAALSFTSSPSDPLGRIPILAILQGGQYVEDMSLDCGEVLYDFLTENNKERKQKQ